MCYLPKLEMQKERAKTNSGHGSMLWLIVTVFTTLLILAIYGSWKSLRSINYAVVMETSRQLMIEKCNISNDLSAQQSLLEHYSNVPLFIYDHTSGTCTSTAGKYCHNIWRVAVRVSYKLNAVIT